MCNQPTLSLQKGRLLYALVKYPHPGNSPNRDTPLKRTVNVGCILCYLLLLYTTEMLEYNYFVEH